MDKEQYKQRLHTLVEQLKAQEDKELLNFLVSELLAISGESKIDEIYEYCIEKVVTQQAKDFYSDFPLKDIVPTLEYDFVRMERARRHNDFKDFCLALYQQIECMTNRLCRDKILTEIVEKMWSCPPFVSIHYGEPEIPFGERIKERKTSDKIPSIAKLVLIPSADFDKKVFITLQNQYAMDKIRIIIYFVCYQTLLTNYGEYSEITKTMNEIYCCRNLNHRGNELKEWEQKIVEQILKQESYYYFKFMGVLALYVSQIQTGIVCLSNIFDYAQTITPTTIKHTIPGPKVVGKIDLPEDNKKRFK